MRSNNLFTYLLYALLGLLVLAAGYLALEKSKKDAQIAEERKKDNQQLDETIKEYGYVDSNQTNTSTYVGETDKKTPVADKNGIERTPAAKSTPATKSNPATAAKSVTTDPQPTTQKAPVSTQLTAKGVAPKQAAAPVNKGRYFVVVGAFGQIENARIEMERFVKMGYRDAEVVKYKADMWRVVAKRSKTRADAEKYEGDLARQGIDAMVVDSNKK